MNFTTLLAFLQDLTKNNDRSWMVRSRGRYEASKADWLMITGWFINRLSEIEPRLDGLSAHQCVFRLHRDVRFSRCKLPYKTNLGSFIAPGGKKSGHAGYYLHIAADGGSFLGGGVYRPQAACLNLIRQAIDRDGGTLQALLQEEDFRKQFGVLQGTTRLQRVPRGYPKDHPFADLLRHKDFLVRKPLSDALLLQEGALEEIMKGFVCMHSLNRWLNNALTDKEC